MFLILETTPSIVKRGDRNLTLSVREYGVPRDSSPDKHPYRETILRISCQI